MKVLTLTGTRPELIRLAVILKKLDKVLGRNHVHVYTNQNYDPNLSDIFLKDLQIKVDYVFPASKGLGAFLSKGIMEFDEILETEKPDKVLVLGDTNSALFSILAAKKGIPVYHMEAGNRCYDGAVPEETNRKIVDACSYVNLPYTENSKENLVREGHHKNRVFKIGNPINEVLHHYSSFISASDILKRLDLFTSKFALLTFHRTENVDNKWVATQVVTAVNFISKELPVVFPLHPRTKDKFEQFGLTFAPNVIITEPLGFFDFVKLEGHATFVLTDSGTVPEECSLFRVPCIVLRNTTERQELMEQGSFILSGYKTADILLAVRSLKEYRPNWEELADYTKTDVSDTVVRILLGYTPTITRKGHDEY